MDAAMSYGPDGLYALLPSVHRVRDEEQGFPLRALLRVIAEQVDVVENDIERLYDNWFVETAEDWVIPYLGDLIGYEPVRDAGEPGAVTTPQGAERNKILIPRREIANTIRYRRRKGTLALLEELARAVSGWPARAVEFYSHLGWTQHVNHVHMARGRLVDVRDLEPLDHLDSPFDCLAHTVDVRRTVSNRQQGRLNIPSVGVFVWRLKAYSITRAPAACLDESPHCYTFSVIGNDTGLHNRPEPEVDPDHIADELNLPTPIRRRAFEAHPDRYYGEGKSLQIWLGEPRKPVRLRDIVAADLSDWSYRPKRGQVAVDPERGRIAFPPGHPPGNQIVWVSYQYAFSGDIGAGEYSRPLSQPPQYTLYRVGEGATFARINDALAQWKADRASVAQPEARLLHAVVEITDSGLYEEQFNIVLEENQTLQVRASSGKRPAIGLSDSKRALLDALSVSGAPGTRLTLDGLLILGRSIQIGGAGQGEEVDGERTEGTAVEYKRVPPTTPVGEPPCGGDPKDRPLDVEIRHCTLVPGWGLDCDCEPRQPSKPSIELRNANVHLTIEHSIVGAIQVVQDEVRTDPSVIVLSDSILDATASEREALDAPGYPVAHVVLTARRCTVIGHVKTHAVALAENCIFYGKVTVARRQYGCIRFSYVSPRSRTPRRFHCEPDLAMQKAAESLRAEAAKGGAPAPAADAIREAERGARARVRPRFNSLRFGRSRYCQLALSCAEEISTGADDESEMGAFHDLYQPQRAANLRVRLTEFVPAGADAGIIFAS
jgi:hypothetical protein